MADGASLVAALPAAKTAIDIARLIKESGVSVEKAEWNYRIAELMGAVADVKTQLALVQDDLASRDHRIAELSEALEVKATVGRVNDAYYRQQEDGTFIGTPYCLRCWESDHRLRSLVQSSSNGRESLCPSCGTKYRESHTGTFKTPVRVEPA